MKKVGIIIVNYKDYAERFLDECRDSLRGQDCSDLDFQVYIVDNASSEKSRKYLSDNFKEAKVLMREDGNYSAANNLGINEAKKDGCQYFVIANMDMKFDNNWLLELIKAVDCGDDIGIAQSKILLYPQKGEKAKINTLGNIIHFLGFGFTKGYNDDCEDVEDITEIKGYASGSSFVIKKEVLEKIGGYNEEHYMYHDDLEMGWKARLAGYRIVLASKSVCFHKYEFSRSVRMLYYMERNRYLVFFSFYHPFTIATLLPALIFMDLGMLFFSVINGWFGVKIKVYLYFLNINNWRKLLIERKRIQKMRIKKDCEIVKDFQGMVLFQEIENPVLKYIANPFFNLYWYIAKKLIIW